MSTSPNSGDSGQPPEKKKRRQNVACDSCRLRRVKCDMLALLTPPDSTRVMPPLPVLVRQNPDISCSNCISKGIRCTTNQIVNPSKPNKGGKRIEEAKKMYGSEGLVFTPSGSGTAAPPTPALTFTGPHDVPGPTRQTSQTTTTSSASSSSYDQSDSSGLPPTSVDLNSSASFMPYGTQFPYPGTDLLNQGASNNPTASAPTWTTEWSSNAVSTPYGTPFEMGLFDMGGPAATEPPAWDPFVFPPTPSGPFGQAEQSSYSAPSLYSSSAGTLPTLPLPTLDDAPGVESDHAAFPSMTPAATFDSRPKSFRRHDSGDNSPVPPSQPVYGLAPVESFSTSSSSSRSSSTSSAPSQIVGKKRQHADDDVIEIARDINDEDDDPKEPWSIWANPNKERQDKVIRWSRGDNVGDALASRALGSELSRHLVRVYFSSVHLTLPAISPEAFYMSWQQAGERSDRMTPAQEVLCAVIEAWAARFSDHPVVLGMDPNKPRKSPKYGGSDDPGSVTIDQSNYGRLRLRVCVALVERARKLIDRHGILRKPSVTGAQALALFTQLQHMTDHCPEAAEVVMETEMLHTVLVQQLRRLDRCWVNEDEPPTYADDGQTTTAQQRIKQRRMFWTVLVADSFWAAGTCCQPVFPDEDVEASLTWLNTVDTKYMPSTFNAISFFMRHYHRVACLTREVARKMSVPSKRPGRVDVTEFCQNTRAIWSGVRDLYRDLNMHVEEMLLSCKEEILGFSPVHQFTNLRLSTTYILLLMQQMVQQLLDFRRRLHEAYIFDDTIPLQAQPEAARVAALEELNSQSIDILLANARAQAPLFKGLLPTGFIQGGSMIIRILLACAQFLAEVPTNEQGYPSHTRGGVDWTWENKQAEVDCCVKALHQLGWAWADVSPVLTKIKMAMIRQTPSPECLLAYAFNAQNISSEADKQASQRKRDLKRDAQAMDSVLQFWPPLSVPNALGGLSERQRAVKQVEAYAYSRGLFENTTFRTRLSPEQASDPASTMFASAQPGPAPDLESVRAPALRHRAPPLSGWAALPVAAVLHPDTGLHLQGEPPAAATAGPAPSTNPYDPTSSFAAGLGDTADVDLSSELESFLESLVSGMPELAESVAN